MFPSLRPTMNKRRPTSKNKPNNNRILAFYLTKLKQSLSFLIFLNYNKDYNSIFQKVLALCKPGNYNLALAICENLHKIDETHYKMKLDLETILKNYFVLVGNISFKDSYEKFKGKVRIICGKDSNGVQPEFFSSFDSVFGNTKDII